MPTERRPMVKLGSKEVFAHSLGWVQQIPLSPGGDLVPYKKEKGSVPLEDLLRIKGSPLCMRLNELQRSLRECKCASTAEGDGAHLPALPGHSVSLDR